MKSYMEMKVALRLMFPFAFIFVLEGCQKDRDEPPAPGMGAVSKTTERQIQAAAVMVHAGESIQSAINKVEPNSVIRIESGTYKESITIDKPGISLAGEGSVLLQNPGGAAIGIVVQEGADGFQLKNVTILDFMERGVQITHVNGFTLSQVTVIHNGEFGLFAEFCKNGQIEHCEGTGHAETSVFVGQSTDVTVTQNKGYANVIGFEVENSENIVLEKNHSYNNAVGILCLLVPNRILKQSSRITLAQNQVRENSHPNFSKPPEMESVLPSGIGILVVGADNTVVQGNHVTDNPFTGIAVVSTLIIGALTQLPPEAFADIEPNPDETLVIDNHLMHNGSAAPPGLPLPAADLLWDGSGNQNCWKNNSFSTSFPGTLPACN